MISRASSTRATLLALIAALAAGCGGGGTTTPVTAQSPSQKTALVQFQITVRSPSSTARRPAYISTSTKSASIAVTPSGGSAGTPTIVNCTTVCSAQVLAPVGSDTFAVKLFDAQNAGGNLLSTGTLTQTIVIDQANTVSVTFNGVVASLSVVLTPSSVTAGTSTTVAVSANALDADGNTIIGPGSYANASGGALTVTLADSDGSSATHLSQSSLSAPTSGITLSYNGAAIANPTITASATGLTSAQAILTISTGVHTITEFAIPNGYSYVNAPEYITTGPDGNLWFTENGVSKIGRVTPSGTITEFATPTNNSRPDVITTGPDGNLWFTEENAGKIGRVTPSGSITEFATPTSGSGPYVITTGPDGNLWFTEYNVSKIGKINP